MMSHMHSYFISRDQDASLCIGCELNDICLDPDNGKCLRRTSKSCGLLETITVQEHIHIRGVCSIFVKIYCKFVSEGATH
jgi:hypothetical protein